MGNACLFGINNNSKEVNLEESVTKIQINNPLNTDGIENNKKSKMSQILDYFNEEEAEIIKEYKEKKKKTKNISKKNINEKYEVILHRLLEQQKIKINGPKRRETIRKEENNIQNLVQEILQENKNDILKGTKMEINNTLIIKQPLQKKGRASISIGNNSLIINHKRGDNFFKKRNSLNEMININELATFQKNQTNNS